MLFMAKTDVFIGWNCFPYYLLTIFSVFINIFVFILLHIYVAITESFVEKWVWRLLYDFKLLFGFIDILFVVDILFICLPYPLFLLLFVDLKLNKYTMPIVFAQTRKLFLVVELR